ncbi:MAG TPA: hypothetical protein PKD64_18700 [Pirellulaceae bacterium]|nr:hypothetical protein [Pirellulaceae bacterium]HMO94221.1 hypothetical protein [Pirellulaceae bacterium]HMP71332.1 hypothetical protein [Pirellulaceae bacterium]
MFLTVDLPDATQYETFPNASYDGNPLHEDERVFPEDQLPCDEFHSMNADQVIDYLWRDGMVPEWIDLSVVAANQQYTIIELLCCGRFTANSDLLYYTHVGRGPFGVKGPALPPDYDFNNPKRFALFNPRDRRKKYQQSTDNNPSNLE